MRGADEKREAMLSYVSPEKRVPREHPLRGDGQNAKYPVRAVARVVAALLKKRPDSFRQRVLAQQQEDQIGKGKRHQESQQAL